MQRGRFDFPSLGLHPTLESASLLGRDGAPLEKDEVRVIFLLDFLKPGVILRNSRRRALLLLLLCEQWLRLLPRRLGEIYEYMGVHLLA